MPDRASGLRIARSMVSPTANTAVNRVLDFSLGLRQGIEIVGVLGNMRFSLAEGTTLTEADGHQSVHLEESTLEDYPVIVGEDDDNIDTEVIFAQTCFIRSEVEAATRGGSFYSHTVTPSGMVNFPGSVFTARNITHQGECHSSNLAGNCGVLIYYYYVTFTLSEMGLILARRM
jgi:hypothetical protein